MDKKNKVVIIGCGPSGKSEVYRKVLSSKPSIVDGGKPPKNMFIDPLLNKDVSDLKKMVDAYESAVPKFENINSGKILVFGTGGEIDKPNINLFSTGSFDDVYLPAVIYKFDCFALIERYNSNCFKWGVGEFITPFSKFCRDYLGYSFGDTVPAFEVELKYNKYMETHTMDDLYKLEKKSLK